jgi:alpha-L-fucosidase
VLEKAMSRDLAQGARVLASSVLSPAFAAANVLTHAQPWAALESDRSGAWISLVLPKAVTFNMVRLREAIDYGVRIDEFALEVWQDGRWRTIAQHSCLGPRRLIRLDAPATTRKVRLRIIKAAASPVLAEFGLYLLPYLVEEPSIDWDSYLLYAGRITTQHRLPSLYRTFCTAHRWNRTSPGRHH